MLSEAYHTKFFSAQEFDAKENKYLSLLLSKDSMGYAISTHNFKEVFELGHMFFKSNGNDTLDHLMFFLQNFSLVQKKFENVNIALLNNDFTLLPEAFSSEQDIKTHLAFSTGKSDQKNILTQLIRDFRFCFTIQSDLRLYLERSFPQASIRHEGAVNLQLFFNHPSLVKSDLFLVIGDSTIQLMHKATEKLIFYNIYSFSTSEDVLYYLLFAMEQCKLNPLTVKLSIASELAIDSDLAKSIAKYVKHVNYVSLAGTIIKNHAISQLPSHYYFTLLNQHLCES